MRIALAGRPGAGKTSLFELMAHRGSPEAAKSGLRIAHTDVPDPRLGALSLAYRPRKTIPARLQFDDLEQKSGPVWPALSAERREMLAQSDLVLLVCDLFNHLPEDWTQEAHAQWRSTFDEFQIYDLTLIESRLEKVRKLARVGQKPAFPGEPELLEHLERVLESGRPVRSEHLSAEEERGLRGYSFLSDRPILPAFNIDESQLAEGQDRLIEAVTPLLQEMAATGETPTDLPPWVFFCAPVEAQIRELPVEDQKSYLEAFGLRQPAVSQVIRAAYDLAGMQTFFTVGEDEVRAWSVRKGVSAPEAAGVIHTDLEKGFVRAEVFPYREWERFGSEKAARENGAIRLEGKEYIVEDGDILTIRSGLARGR